MCYVYNQWYDISWAILYIFALLLFVADRKNRFKISAGVYNINTRQRFNSHHPLSDLSLYQKGIYSFGINVFNSLSPSI